MSDHDSDVILAEIRKQADRVASLMGQYEHSKAETKLDKLQELTRSHETSDEVADRPLIKAVEQRAERESEADREGDYDYTQCVSCGHAFHSESLVHCPACGEPIHGDDPTDDHTTGSIAESEQDHLDAITAKPKRRKKVAQP